MRKLFLVPVTLLGVTLAGCGNTSTPATIPSPIGLWDATISYQRESGELVSEQRHFLVTDAGTNGAFHSDGFYRTGSSTIDGASISGNTVSGDINLHNALVYDSDSSRDDILCRGTFSSTAYTGNCTIGSGVDFGWQNFKLTMNKRS